MEEVNDDKMDTLQKEIVEENKEHPEYKEANKFTFMCGNIPVTVGYALHALWKEQLRGNHPLSILIEMYSKNRDWEKLMVAIEKAELI